MKNTSKRKVVNVDKPNHAPIFEFKQLDNVVLKLSLFKDSVEFDITGQTLKLGAKTNDGLKEQTEGFTINKNNLDIDLKNSILVPGEVEIDLELKDANGAMTTASFFITVKSKVLNDKAVEGTNEYDTFTKTVAKVKEDYKGLRRIIIDENQAANLQDQVNQTNAHLETIINDKRNSFQLPQSNGIDDTSVIQKAINENMHINFSQGETYIIKKPLICTENNFLHLNYSTLKAGDEFNGDCLISFDTGVVGWSFTNAGVFNGTLDCDYKCGGIKARGPVDRFNLDDLFILNLTKPSIFIYSRNRVFGRESEGFYGEESQFGAEGFNISKVKVIPNCDLGDNPCLLIEDSNEFTIEDSKFFGNNGKGALSPTNVNKYGCLITKRVSTNVFMNPLLKNVAFAGFNSYGLKFYKYLYPNLISCTFEMLNNSIIFEETQGITFKDNRMMSPSGFDRPKIKLLKSSYFNVDISNHCFGETNYKPIIDVTDCTTGTIKSNILVEINETNSKDIIYEQINQNGGKFLKGSNSNGTYADFNKALLDIDCGNNRTTPIILFHKEGVSTLGVGADGNLMLKNGIKFYSGTDSPEGIVVASQGSVYIRSNPTNANEVIYVKASGYNTNTGWIAK